MADPTAPESRSADQQVVEHELAHIYQVAKSRVKALAIGYHPDLQPVGFGILRFVFDEQPVRAQDITAALGMDKGAVSRQVTALRDMGLVETREDPEDRRAVLLVPSDDALAKRNAFRRETKSGYGKAFADWPDDEIAEFARLLTKFNASI